MTIEDRDHVVIRFSGDSGDGMQLTGTQFSNTSAFMGNDIATFPDYPAEIRAPQGTLAGVSGFQVHFGATEISTPGDEVDMLVAMNPAALKVNLGSVRAGGCVIVNTDSFDEKNIAKATYSANPLTDNSLSSYKVIQVAVTTQTLEALKDSPLDSKSKDRCKNFYALGMTYFFYHRTLDSTIKWIEQKFKNKEEVKKGNIAVLKAGYNFAETLESFISTYKVAPASLTKGLYRQIDGNTATAFGFLKAAEDAKLTLFLGSYPITPATDILHELANYKHLGVKTFQAEDEIAAISSAIGAASAGSLAITTTSGPGMALKTEALGLAISYELPLIVVNVQRGGPSTGLPTKTEQSDLFQAIYGRNGESPVVVIAASHPSDCFWSAYEASKIALKYMCPVIYLSDGYIANGSEPWKIPNFEKDFSPIVHHQNDSVDIINGKVQHMKRDEITKARPWIIPGTKGQEYRIGGLEKDIKTGSVSYDSMNHEKMCQLRAAKIDALADELPPQTVMGESSGDLLVVSWGGTFGAVMTSVRQLQKEGIRISHLHLRYLNPMPKNVGSLLKSFKKVLVPELNLGQLKAVLNARYSVNAVGYNKVQGLPFKVSELVAAFKKELQQESSNK
jgi:2-oxoglutarate ferredoxin oxidoreductase subunit alpha